MNKLIIAKPGKNALTETNPDNLIFSSDYNTLKYSLSGYFQMNVGVLTGSGTIEQNITHNLGYVPFFIVYVNQFGHDTSQYGLTEYFDTLGRLKAARAYADSSKIYLSLNLDAGPAITAEWYYKIFKNNLGL